MHCVSVPFLPHFLHARQLKAAAFPTGRLLSKGIFFLSSLHLTNRGDNIQDSFCTLGDERTFFLLPEKIHAPQLVTAHFCSAEKTPIREVGSWKKHATFEPAHLLSSLAISFYRGALSKLLPSSLKRVIRSEERSPILFSPSL